MKPETIYEVIEKITGQIRPIGASHVDSERLDNLDTMCKVVTLMIADIKKMVDDHKDAHEFSVRVAVKAGEEFLTEIKELISDQQ